MKRRMYRWNQAVLCGFLVAPLAAQTGVSLPQAPPEKQQVGAEQIRLIGPEVTLIEETGLQMDSGDLTKGEEVRAAKFDWAAMSAPSSHTMKTQGAQTAKSVKLYRFELQPKESIALSLDIAEESRVFLKLGEMKGGAPPSAATTAQIERVNRVQPVTRSKKIQFRNMEPRTYSVLLVAYGENGYPYKIRVERKL